jgi:hypothetical protein
LPIARIDNKAPVPKIIPKTAIQTARILSIEVALEAVSLLSEFTLEVLPNKKGGRAIKMTPSKLTMAANASCLE